LQPAVDLADFNLLAAMERAAVVTQPSPKQSSPAINDDESRVAQFVGHAVEPDVSLPKEQLARIRIGLQLHYVAAVIYLLAIVLGSIGVAGAMIGTGAIVAASAGGPSGVSGPADGVKVRQGIGKGIAVGILSAAGIAMLVAFGVAWIAPIMDLVGSFFCLSLPVEHDCRWWVLASLVCRFMHPVVFGVLSFLAVSWELAVVAYVGCVIVVVGEWLLFMVGLQRFALFLKRSELHDEAAQIMGFGAALVLVSMLVPGMLTWLLTAGHWQWWLVFVFCGGLISYWLFRSNSLAFLTNVFWYGTGIGFLVQYSNFLGSLHNVRVKVR